MSNTTATPPAASKDPRRDYLRYADLQAHLAGLAAKHPDLVRLERIGSSSAGRPLYAIIVGVEPDRLRPALWVDANMHASELLGTNVALNFVDDLLALHAGENRHQLSAPVVQAALAALVYVVPTMSPDGMEAVHETGQFVRSSPLNERQTKRPRWRQVDLDGDGQVRRLRVKDPCGAFVASKDIPGLMLPRTVDDEGPFYALYPEGVIDDWDGDAVPAWGIFDDNPLDLNRHFTWGWKPEPHQEGAGDFAGQSPEARAIMSFATASPHVYFWVNLHCYGGVWIRPLGDGPDSKLAYGDRAVLKEVEAWAERHAGVPTVSGFEEFTYVPDKPLAGDLVDYAFHQRGAYAWAVELWDIYTRAGLPRGKRFVERYTDQTAADITHLTRALRQLGNDGLEAWRPLQHPQLGDVEVGGFDPRFSVWNPPPGPLVDDISRRHAAVFLRMLALLPQLVVTTTSTSLGAHTLVEVTVENRAGIQTVGPEVARGLPHVEVLQVELVDPHRAVDGPRRTLGHLGGPQLGRFGAGTTWPYQNTEGDPCRRRCRFVVKGTEPLALRVGSVRTGFVDVSVDVSVAVGVNDRST